MWWTVWASNLVEEEIFPFSSLLFNHYRCLKYSPPTSADVKKNWSHNSSPLYLIMALTGTALHFTSPNTMSWKYWEVKLQRYIFLLQVELDDLFHDKTILFQGKVLLVPTGWVAAWVDKEQNIGPYQNSTLVQNYLCYLYMQQIWRVMKGGCFNSLENLMDNWDVRFSGRWMGRILLAGLWVRRVTCNLHTLALKLKSQIL